MLEVDEQNIHLVHLPRFRIGKWWWWWPVVGGSGGGDAHAFVFFVCCFL